MAFPSEFSLHAVIFAALSAAAFGAALVTTHSGLRHLDAMSGAKVSIPTATLLFWLLSPFMNIAGWHPAGVGVFALVGLFFPAAVTLLTFEANRRLGPNMTGAIGSTAPLFAVLGAALFLDEALGFRELGATFLIMLGSVVLTKSHRADAGGHQRGALWLPWSAAALRALAQLLSKAGLVLWPNPFAAALIGYTVSSAVVWATAWGRNARRPEFNRAGIAWFAVTGVLNGAAVLSLYVALNSGTVTLVSPIVATYPLFALALSAWTLREKRVSGVLIAGVVLTVAGVVMLLAGR